MQYEAYVDRHARRRNHNIELVKETFYGQLQHIVTLYLPPITGSSHTSPASLVFAFVRTCKIDRDHPSLDIHYYTDKGTLDVLDITTVQSLPAVMDNLN